MIASLDIVERLGSYLYLVFIACSLAVCLYYGVRFIVIRIDRIIPGTKKRQHQRKVHKVKRLKEKYPDAYNEWYPKESLFFPLSDSDLDERLGHSIFDWREKQRVLDEKKEVYNQRMTRANEICSSYPHAYRKLLGKQFLEFSQDFASQLKWILDETPIVQLSPLAESASKPQKHKQIRKDVENRYSLSESEVSTLLNTSESDFAAIEDRIQADFSVRFLEICQSFPDGLESLYAKYPFIRKYLSSAIVKIFIVAHEPQIIEYQQAYPECKSYESWEKEQEVFTDSLINMDCVENSDWGYSYDSIFVDGIGLWGNRKKYHSNVLHFFRGGICVDKSLDYSLIKGQIFGPEEPVWINTFRYEEAAAIISRIPDITVLSTENDWGDDWDFKREVMNRPSVSDVAFIPFSEYLKDEDLEPKKVLILQSITSQKNIKEYCEIIFQKKKLKPVVACLSYLKEFSSQETEMFIAEEKKRINEEKERLEQERLYAIAHTNKTNWTEFREYLRWNGVSYFYHFTDRSNLNSIREHGGLFSWKYCEDHNILIPRAGGSELGRLLDEKYNLEDYVRLSFCDDHPMAYRLRQDGYNLVLLKIDVRVAWLQDTLFSDINATDSSHHHGGNLEDLKRVDIAATKEHYVSQESPSFKKHQAEVLVKTFIPIEYITMPYHSSNNGILGDISLVKTQTQTERWKEKDRRNFTLEEINAIESNEIVASTYGLSVRFVMKGGGITYLPLSTSSSKGVGESIDLTIAKLITLGKKGAGDIYRIEI